MRHDKLDTVGTNLILGLGLASTRDGQRTKLVDRLDSKRQLGRGGRTLRGCIMVDPVRGGFAQDFLEGFTIPLWKLQVIYDPRFERSTWYSARCT